MSANDSVVLFERATARAATVAPIRSSHREYRHRASFVYE